MHDISTIKHNIHLQIDAMSIQSLYAIKPLLDFLANEPIIEAALTQDEINLIDNGYKEYKTHPENFMPLETAFP